MIKQSKKKRVHIIISGDVQGVGYRSWTMHQAQKFALTGLVKNRKDGCVEVIAEGDKDQIEKFVSVCRTGPDTAWVKSVDEHWLDGTGEYDTFQVV